MTCNLQGNVVQLRREVNWLKGRPISRGHFCQSNHFVQHLAGKVLCRRGSFCVKRDFAYSLKDLSNFCGLL